jgi:hypothetical protein
MSRKKISTTIYVTPEQSEKLKVLHDRTKVPVAVYIREGIDLVLLHYGHLLPGQLPLDGAQARSEPRAERARAFGRSATTAADLDSDDGESDAEHAPSSSTPAQAAGHAAAHAASKK